MKKKSVEQVLPLNLQFFAEGDDDIDDPGTGEEGDGDNDDQGGKSSDKTFTQAEVTAMMTREKKEGRKALLKQLGFKTEAEAKNAIVLYNALVESQKTDEDKVKEKEQTLESEKSDAEKRAELAENKLSCVMAGVKNDSVDDVLAIALLKVTEEKNLDTVLSEMKKESRYVGFFKEEGEGDGDNGTGSNPGHTKDKGDDGDKKGSYGASLAKSQKPSTKKKTYF